MERSLVVKGAIGAIGATLGMVVICGNYMYTYPEIRSAREAELRTLVKPIADRNLPVAPQCSAWFFHVLQVRLGGGEAALSRMLLATAHHMSAIRWAMTHRIRTNRAYPQRDKLEGLMNLTARGCKHVSIY